MGGVRLGVPPRKPRPASPRGRFSFRRKASFFLNDQKETKESPGVGRGWLSAQRAGLGQSACTPGPPEGLRGRQPGCTDSFPARNLRRRGRFPRRPPALCGYAFGSFQHPRGRLAGRWNGLFGPIEGRLAEEPQEVPGFESGRCIFLLILFLARRPIGCLSLPSLCPQKGIACQGDLRTVVSRTPESCRCTFTDAPANFNGGSGGQSLLAKPRPGGRRPIRDAPPAILCLLSVRTESRSPSGRNPNSAFRPKPEKRTDASRHRFFPVLSFSWGRGFRRGAAAGGQPMAACCSSSLAIRAFNFSARSRSPATTASGA